MMRFSASTLLALFGVLIVVGGMVEEIPGRFLIGMTALGNGGYREWISRSPAIDANDAGTVLGVCGECKNSGSLCLLIGPIRLYETEPYDVARIALHTKSYSRMDEHPGRTPRPDLPDRCRVAASPE